MAKQPSKEVMTVVHKILDIKNKKADVMARKSLAYQKYKEMVGREQELSRELNEQLDELEAFRSEK